MFSKFCLMGLSFGLMAGAVADVVVTNTLAQFPNNSESSLSTPGNWTLGYADDDLHNSYVFHADTYNGRCWANYVTATGPKVMTIPGRAWVLGTVGGSTSPMYYLRNGWLVFSNDGLFLARGTLQIWADSLASGNIHSRERRITGNVTVLSPDANPYHLRFNGVSTTNCFFSFNGKLSSAEGTTLLVKQTAVGTVDSVDYGQGIRLMSDLSDFRGTLKVDKYLFLEAMNQVADKACPGTFDIGSHSVLRLSGMSDTLGVGELAFDADAAIEYTFGVDSAKKLTCSSITVSRAFSTASPLPIHLINALGTNSWVLMEMSYPLIRMPKTCDVTLDDFVLDVPGGSGIISMNLALVEEGDEKVLRLVRQGTVVHSTRGMTTASTEKSPFGDDADIWDRTVDPSEVPNTDYQAVGDPLRTKSGLAADDFRGRSLTFNGHTLVLQAKTTQISDLYSYGMSIANWHENGDKTTNTFAAGGTKRLSGRLTVLANSTVTQNGQGLYLDLAMDLVSETNRVLTFSVNDGAKSSWLELSGENSGWYGKVQAYPAVSSSAGKVRPVATFDNTAVLVVRSGSAFGAPLPEFVRDSLYLYNKAILWTPEDVVLDDATRGIKIGPAGAGLQVSEGKTLTLKQTVHLASANAPLVKLGAGTLALGGSFLFGSAATETPVANYDGFEVQEGSIKALSKAACNGLRITMGEDATLLVGNAPADVAETGLYNVTAATPFVLPADGKLHVALDVDQPSGKTFSAPICTVKTGTLSIEQIAAQRPWSNYDVKVSATTDAVAGTTTFTATFTPSGCIVIFR